MKRLPYYFIALFNVALVSAQSSNFGLGEGMFDGIGGAIRMIASGAGELVAGGPVSQNEAINIGLIWIAGAVMLHDMLITRIGKLGNKAQWGLSFMFAYLIINTAIIKTIMMGFQIGSLMIIILIIVLLSKFIKKTTIPESTKQTHAKHMNKVDSDREKGRTKSNIRLQNIVEMLDRGEKELITKEEHLREIEKNESKDELSLLQSIIPDLQLEEKIKAQLNWMTKQMMKVREPGALKNIESRIQDYNRRLSELESKIKILFDKFNTDLNKDIQAATQEEADVEQEIGEDREAKKTDLKIIHNDKKNKHLEDHDAKNHHLDIADKQLDFTKETQTNTEISMEERKIQIENNIFDVLIKKESNEKTVIKIIEKIEQIENSEGENVHLDDMVKLEQLVIKKNKLLQENDSIDQKEKKLNEELETMSESVKNVESEELKPAA